MVYSPGAGPGSRAADRLCTNGTGGSRSGTSHWPPGTWRIQLVTMPAAFYTSAANNRAWLTSPHGELLRLNTHPQRLPARAPSVRGDVGTASGYRWFIWRNQEHSRFWRCWFTFDETIS